MTINTKIIDVRECIVAGEACSSINTACDTVINAAITSTSIRCSIKDIERIYTSTAGSIAATSKTVSRTYNTDAIIRSNRKLGSIACSANIVA